MHETPLTLRFVCRASGAKAAKWTPTRCRSPRRKSGHSSPQTARADIAAVNETPLTPPTLCGSLGRKSGHSSPETARADVAAVNETPLTPPARCRSLGRKSGHPSAQAARPDIAAVHETPLRIRDAGRKPPAETGPYLAAGREARRRRRVHETALRLRDAGPKASAEIGPFHAASREARRRRHAPNSAQDPGRRAEGSGRNRAIPRRRRRGQTSPLCTKLRSGSGTPGRRLRPKSRKSSPQAARPDVAAVHETPLRLRDAVPKPPAEIGPLLAGGGEARWGRRARNCGDATDGVPRPRAKVGPFLAAGGEGRRRCCARNSTHAPGCSGEATGKNHRRPATQHRSLRRRSDHPSPQAARPDVAPVHETCRMRREPAAERRTQMAPAPRARRKGQAAKEQKRDAGG